MSHFLHLLARLLMDVPDDSVDGNTSSKVWVIVVIAVVAVVAAAAIWVLLRRRKQG